MWRIIIFLICALNSISGNPIFELSKEDQENLKIYLRTVEGYYGQIKSRIEKRSIDSDSDDGFIGSLSAKFTGGNAEPEAICPACGFLIGMIKGFINDGLPDGNIIDTAVYFCQEYSGMPPGICLGLLNSNMPPLLNILRAQDLTPSEICSVVVDQACLQPDDPPRNWTVDLPPFPDSELEETEIEIPDDGPKFEVLHISDIHLDLAYAINVSAECSYPLCCKEYSEEPEPNKAKSGKWGGRKCDTPLETIEYLLRYVQKNHPNINCIYLTGDIPAHDFWSIDKNDSLLAINKTLSLFAEIFPNTPVLYAIGNHEAVPMNMFPTIDDVSEENKIDWLYNALSEKLTKWLPEDVTTTIKAGGYYTVVIRPGLRVISLNTNFCYIQNWWLALNNTDPAQELQWLIKTLQEAEMNGEKVHIIGHVPPSYKDCLNVWKRNFYRIVNRFAGIISGQFYGHSHKDEISLHFDENNTEKAIGVEYIGCSVTPYTYLNPCYTIFHIDGERPNSTWLPIDRTCYYFNLDEANANVDKDPDWIKLYSARDAYNMTSLSPEEWKWKLYDRLKTNDVPLCNSYLNFSYRNSIKTPPCNIENTLCKIKSCPIYGRDSFSESKNSDDSTLSPENGDNATTTSAPIEGTTNSSTDNYGDPRTEPFEGTGSTSSPNYIGNTENPNTTDNSNGSENTTGYADDSTTKTDDTSNMNTTGDSTSTKNPDGKSNTESQVE